MEGTHTRRHGESDGGEARRRLHGGLGLAPALRVEPVAASEDVHLRAHSLEPPAEDVLEVLDRRRPGDVRAATEDERARAVRAQSDGDEGLEDERHRARGTDVELEPTTVDLPGLKTH